MDDDFEITHGGIMACFPSCLRHLLKRVSSHGPATSDPERQPLFPPPSTVLTPPRPRPNPLPSLAGAIGSGAPWSAENDSLPTAKSSAALGRGKNSYISEEGRAKMDSISKAFAGRMKPLHPNASLPPTPSSAHGVRPLSTHPSTSTLMMTKSNSEHLASRLHDQSTTRNDRRQEEEQERGSDDRPLPFRPSVPNLGRSASEPRNLVDLGGFAPHQVPRGSSVDVGNRGRGGRSRSATTTITTLEGGRGRGRSSGPGPFVVALESSDRTPLREARQNEGALGMGRSISHPGLSSLRLTAKSGENSTAGEEADVEVEVVKKELGLKGLYGTTSISSGSSAGSASKRGRSRGRGGRPKGVKRVMTG